MSLCSSSKHQHLASVSARILHSSILPKESSRLKETSNGKHNKLLIYSHQLNLMPTIVYKQSILRCEQDYNIIIVVNRSPINLYIASSKIPLERESFATSQFKTIGKLCIDRSHSSKL